MKKLAIVLSLLLLLAACSRSRPPQLDTPTPTPEGATLLGQLEVTFTVDPDSQTLTTSAVPGLATQGLVGRLSTENLSNGLIDKDGFRYLYGTYRVTNNGGALSNLSFYAMNTSGAIGGTAVKDLRNAKGETLTSTTFARTILPTHRMEDNSGTLGVKEGEADFQGFAAQDINALQNQNPGGTLLEYGYSARNTSGGRAIAANGSGLVSFAIKFPFDPARSADLPFSFTLVFATVDDTATQVTRSAEEAPNSAAAVCARANAVNATKVVVIGSSLPASVPAGCELTRLNDVKVAVDVGGLGAKYLLGNGAGAAAPDLSLAYGPLVYTTQNGATSAAQTVTLSNIGDAPLTVSGLSFVGAHAGEFGLAGAPATPLTIQAGTSQTLNVVFKPTSTGPKGAFLRVGSNDPDTAQAEVKVRGLGVIGTGGSNEPSLQWILDTLELPVTVGDPDPSNNALPTTPLLGEEISAPRFEKAGAGNVTVELLAVFGPTNNTPVTGFGWYTESSTTELFTVSNSPVSNGQRLLPPLAGATSFDPGNASFGLYSRWPFFSNRFVYSEDGKNTWETNAANRHKVRVYPLKNSSGVVPNAYIVATEETTSGFDYQDIVVILRNVRPVAPVSPTACTPRSTLPCSDVEVSLPYSLTWSGDEGELNDKNGVGTGFTMVDPPSARISADGATSNPDVPGYEPSRLTVNGGALSIASNKGIMYLKPSGSGTTSSDTNSQINALGVGVDANAQNLRVESTFLKPNFPSNANSEQLGVWFGLDEDNYFKLVLVNMGSGDVKLQMLREVNAVADSSNEINSSTFALATNAPVRVALVLNKATGQVDAFYSINGGAEVKLGSFSVADKFFGGVSLSGADPVSFAGVFTTQRRGSSSFNAVFNDFSVTVPAADTTAPTVDVVVSGTTNSSGDYLDQATVTVSASDTGGAGLASTSYSLDGGPYQTYSGPVTVNTAGNHTVTARAVDGAGNTTNTPIQGFKVVVPPPSNAVITTQNLDAVPATDWLTFSRIGAGEPGETPPAGNRVHDLVTLQIKNTGSSDALVISALTLSGTDSANWRLEGAPTLPASINAGGSINIGVRFLAKSNRKVHRAALLIQSNASNGATTTLQLGGWWQSVSEGGQEPSVQQIVDAFGWKTKIVGSGQKLNQQGLHEAIGDEVLSAYWRRADTGKPVTVRQLAAFHSCCSSTASVYWHYKGSTSTKNIFTHDVKDGQSLLPLKNGSSSAAVGTFSPSTGTANGVFGWKIDPEWSDHTKNNGQGDIKNGCAGTQPSDCGHHMRFWPVKDSLGNVVPNTYLMWMDYSGINYDYNDNGYIVTNIEPETAQ